ncbi:hypothetical protein ACSFA7_19800 [Variovorax sp. LT1R20]|uniref:hypothetical protein n=1 Tax=Variovorax sp. LT1R20 TaxID=3443729 RepID=UPI003F474BB1
MDTSKRTRLIEQLAPKPEPQIVSIEAFFDGNDDLGSIGCNLMEHPGMDVFRDTFARIARRPDVTAVYAQIAELDPGEDCWPFADTIFVVGSLSENELAEALAPLEPDEIWKTEDSDIPSDIQKGHDTHVLAAWWD